MNSISCIILGCHLLLSLLFFQLIIIIVITFKMLFFIYDITYNAGRRDRLPLFLI